MSNNYPLTYEEATVLGTKMYFSGTQCIRGHIAPRYTSSRMCVECTKLHYKKNRPVILQRAKKRYAANPEKYMAENQQRALADPKKYWAKNALKTAKKRAEKYGVPFSITLDYLISIVPVVCPVFGTPFVLCGNKKACGDSATLDRLKPALGYVPGNVVVISQTANSIKYNATAKEVARVAQWMYEAGL